MNRRISVVVLPAVLSVTGAANAAISTSGLTLVQQGPVGAANSVPAGPANLAPGGVAFSDGDFPNPAHTTAHLNDSMYGNGNSWISDIDADGWAGISFGTSQAISGIAWGRDNTGGFGDRNTGTYTIQYRNDSSTANDSGWTTIGTANYNATAVPTVGLALNQAHPAFETNTAIRHGYNFPTINATNIRIVVPDGNGPNSGNSTDIDEIELYSSALTPGAGARAPQKGKLTWDGNEAVNFNSVAPTAAAGNLAPAGTAFSTGAYPAAAHSTAHLNDGFYGNDNSWLSDPNVAAPNAGIDLAGTGLYKITSIAFGRDNRTTGDGMNPPDGFNPTDGNDRSTGTYTLQYTLLHNSAGLSDTGDPTTGWATVSTLDYLSDQDANSQTGGDGHFTPVYRHEYGVTLADGSPLEAAGLRLVVANNADAIDEFEIFGTAAVPEPTSLGLIGFAGMLLVRRRRRA